MPAFQPDQVGPLYDLGLSTRDGSFLICKDRNGNPVEVSSIAYMCSIDKQRTMREGTELQEKAQLIQFASSNLIDREFDQWPQVTQGDWSGGLGQRVFGANNDQTRYWDGEGLVWPLNDWQPQQPFVGPVINKPASWFGAAPFSYSTGSGYVTNIGNGYAFSYTEIAVGPHVVFNSGATSLNLLLAANANLVILDVTVGNGSIWVTSWDSGAGGNVVLTQIGDPTHAGALVVIGTPVNIVTDAGLALGNAGRMRTTIRTAMLANKAYVAVALTYNRSAAAGWSNTVTIYDYSATGAPTSTLLTFPVGVTAFTSASEGPPMFLEDIDFQSGSLYAVMSDGGNVSIVQSSSPFSAVTTLAVLPGLGHAYICTIGATVFVLGWSGIATGASRRAEMFILSGGALSSVGSLSPENVGVIHSVGGCTAFDSYIFFGLTYESNVGANVMKVAIYAYEVTRNRLFRVSTLLGTDFGQGIGRIGVFGEVARTIGGLGAVAQWGMAVNLSGVNLGTNPLIGEYYFGVQPITIPNRDSTWQGPTSLTSGLVDFTAASNKLYRQIVASFSSDLATNQAVPNVTLNVWFDQDPARLSTTPDVTETISGATLPADTSTTGTSQVTQLAAVLNRIARKIVYQVIVAGGGAVLNGESYQNNPKLVSVAIQVSTGWVWDLAINLAPNVKTNATNTQQYAYDNQSQPGMFNVDNVVAYNFIRQLWREKGGQCILTLPNKDVYPALIQSETFDSPKPLAISFRSDQPTTYQNTLTLKIREDV